MVVLTKTRRHLRRAIRELTRVTLPLGLEPHRTKRFIERIDKELIPLG